MDTVTKTSGRPFRVLMSAGLALFGLIAVALVSGCGDGGSEAGGDNILTPMKANPSGVQAASRGGPPVAWSPSSLDASLAPGESETFHVVFTPTVDGTGITTFVVPEIADYVTLSPPSFDSLLAGQIYGIEVTLTSPLDMGVAEKDGTIMLREGRRNLARPLPVNLSFVPKIYTINDTGIDWCADSSSILLSCPVAGHPGQDGDYGRDALAREGKLVKVGGGTAGFDFTKLDVNGLPLAIQDMPWSDGGSETDGNRWSCVRDNVTGLVWEVKVNDSAHLRHQGHTYTWYDPNSPDGNPGTQNGGSCVDSACDTTGFVQAVNAQGLCGSSNWRMPTRLELQGIVDYGRHNPTIDTEYFPNSTVALFWWSASPAANDSDLAWWGLFSVGNFGPGNRGGGYHVRLVHDRR